jgi:hypothetical protein
LTKTGCGLHSGQFFSKIRLEPILETTSEWQLCFFFFFLPIWTTESPTLPQVLGKVKAFKTTMRNAYAVVG